MTERPRLTLLLLGEVPDTALQPLGKAGVDASIVPTPAPASLTLATSGRELNRFIDDATSDWVMVVRSHEAVESELAVEIVEAIRSDRAWGYRLSVDDYYCGALLARGRSAGEIRLFPGAREMLVQGTVVRLRNSLRRENFATRAEHAAFLSARFPRHSFLGRGVGFVSSIFRRGAIFRGWTAIGHAWVESAFNVDSSVTEQNLEN
jgi:hypothetical protein